MAKKWINEENPLKFNAPDKAGLYLVGSTNFNPITKEELYFVKIGEAKSILKNRMKNYQGMNPLMYHIDYDTTSGCSDKVFHNLLKMYLHCPRVEGSNEWFKINREQYLFICELGFKVFKCDNMLKLARLGKK